MKETLKLESTRMMGVKVLTYVVAVLGAIVVAVTMMRGGNWIVFGGSSAAMFALALYASRLGSGLAARVSVTIASVAQVTLIVAAMSGHQWQLDVHMMFFALLAVLTLLACPKSLVVAAGFTAVHHVGLTLLWPTLVYPSVDLSGNLVRTVIHALIVVAETGILLGAVISYLKQLDVLNADQAALSETMAALSQEKIAVDAKEQAQSEVVAQLHDRLTLIASGDLDAEIHEQFPEGYENLRVSFNAAVASLSGIIRSVTSVSSQIETDSAELAEVSASVANSTEKQADALSQVTDAVEYIAEAMSGAVETTEDTQKRFDSTRTVTREGTEVVRQAVTTMDEIEESSSQIDHVVTLIEDIAFQTNLLALNAGVEAARAGEAGAGFAIVASEVRELARRSAEAAQNINALISQSNGHVTKGVSLVRQVGKALETIFEEVNEVSQNISEIAKISNEQSASVTQIRDSMQTIGSETQANAARSEEASAATASLDMAVDRLVQGLSGFRVKDGALQDNSGRRAAA